MSALLNYDGKLFQLINQEWINPYLDKFMRTITLFQETRYLLALLLIIWIFRYRMHAVKIILGACLAVGIADATAARIVKPGFDRKRPEYSLPHVRLIVPSQASESFPSNHAANTFAVAEYLSLAAPVMAPYAFALAVAVSYSRVYVGVHYPLDVIGGACLGIISGVLAYFIFMALLKFLGIKQERPLPQPPRFFARRRRPKRR